MAVYVVQRCPADPVPCFLPSLRVNLDMGKMVYSWMIRRDSKIPGTVVRSSTIPEQLGRISYLLTDKTGEYLCVGVGADGLRLRWWIPVSPGPPSRGGRSGS